MKPKVVSLAPQSHLDWMMRPPVQAALRQEFDLWQSDQPRHLVPEEVVGELQSAVGVLTGWGARPFSPQVLGGSPALKVVAHTAGSPRILFGDDTVRDILIPRGIVVYTGASAMALNVAEITIGLMILASRRLPLQEKSYHAAVQNGARCEELVARDSVFLMGATVGLVSASQVARRVIPLLQAFGCTILVFDPFLSDEAARDLGVARAELNDLFSRCDIVSLHAPDLPATRGMVGAAQLQKMRDGASLINTARGPILDHNALYQECKSGRIFAALDVTEPEPLPVDSPLWNCPHIFLTPHTAGNGRAGFSLIGEGALHALRDAAAGRPIVGAVPLERWDTVA